MNFVNPSILYGLFLVSIPVIIHLFNLKRYKVVYFTNVKFLKELQEETQKQSMLKHLLVLICRILAIVFLVLAFARPYIPTSEDTVITERDFVSVFVDNSFSMQAEGPRGGLLESARRKAQQVFDSHRLTDAFQILNHDFEAVHQRVISKEEVNEHLNNLDFTYHQRHFSEIIERQKNLAEGLHGDRNIFYIISDFQKAMFDYQNLNTDTSYKAVLVPVSTGPTDNVFIDSCWFDTPVRMQHQNMQLQVRIKNHSAHYLERVPATLMINGQQRALTSFDAEPYSTQLISLPFKINNTGLHNAYVEIVDHPITYDDRLYFSFNVSEVISVLCINADAPNRYINNLLGPDSAFVVDNVSEANIDYSALPRYNLIILNGFNSISTGLASEINKFVENGGHFFFIPGSNADLMSYNHFFNKFAPIRINEASSQTLKLNYLNLNHELYAQVFDEFPDNVYLPEVHKHYPYNLPIGLQSEDLIKLQNGQPFLSVFRHGSGTFYLTSTPLGSNYSGFPLHAIFVPTLYNMALQSMPAPPLYYTLGEATAINLPFIHQAGADIYRIRALNDDFEFIPRHQSHFSRLNIEIHDQIENAGLYILSVNETDIAGLAFNYSRAGSEMSYYNLDDLKEIISENDLQQLHVIGTADRSVGEALTAINEGTQLFKIFLILALLFLGLEVLLLRFWK